MPVSITQYSGVNENISTSKQRGSSMLDYLKKTFPSVNFVTARDPLSSANPKARGNNTVYLDKEALKKLEEDPDYAAYLFTEVETSLLYSKHIKVVNKNQLYTKRSNSITLSFYAGNDAPSSASMVFGMRQGQVKANSAAVPSFVSSLLFNRDNKSISGAAKTYASIKDLSGEITRTRNTLYKKWTETFGVTGRTAYTVDADAVYPAVEKQFK